MTTCNQFEQISKLTWETIEAAHKAKITFGEDAITAINLLSLATMIGSAVFIQDTRSKEKLIGADFELWVGIPTGGWRRYAIQAKKINVSTGRYDNLSHHLQSSPYTPQIDLLQAYASANRAIALYCFYNHSLDPFIWNCPKPIDAKQLGCSLTPASVVQLALATRGGRTFKWIHDRPETIPWRCLVCCPSKNQKNQPYFNGWPSEESNFHKSLPDELLEFKAGGIRLLKKHPMGNELGISYWRPTFTIIIPSLPSIPTNKGDISIIK